MSKLTALAVENFKPQSKRKEVPDSGCTGLYLVVQPSGRKSFAVRYRANGKPKKLTLPKGISLAQARAAATAALAEVERGNDPSAAKRTQKHTQQAAAANTLRAVAESYLQREGKKKENERLRSLDRQQRILERLVYPTLGDMPIAGIKRSTIIDLLDKIEDGKLVNGRGERIEGGAVMAESTLAVIRKLLNWYSVRDEDYRSPLVRGMSRVNPKERARSRVLTDTELRAVWKAGSDRADQFSALVKFLLLTGARRSEASSMTWNDIDSTGTWLLPAAHNKVKVDLLRPLSGAALALLEAQPRIPGTAYVFTSSKGPMGSYSRRKRAFDIASGVTGWRLHDLRRTSRTLLSRAGISSDIAERCLGHVIGGIRATYDRHEFSSEKRHAFEALAAEIDLIVHPAPDNVRQLRG